MEFECTKRFKKEYKELKSDNSKIFEDLKKDLFDLSLDQLFNHYQNLGKGHHSVRLKKHRVRNRSKNQSASGGFRIYFQINKETQIIRLMTIYCKVGKRKHAKIALNENEEKQLKDELKFHHQNDCFIKMQIEKNKITFKVPVETTSS